MDAPVFLIVAAIAAFVFGGLGGWISGEKGRGSSEGFCLGLLFGPLGCLIAALMPAQAKAQPAEVQARQAVSSRAERERYARELAADQAYWNERRAKIEAARVRLAEAKQRRIEARNDYYRDRGIKPGPLAWFQALPDWLQATLGGVAVSTPFVLGITLWQVFHGGTT